MLHTGNVPDCLLRSLIYLFLRKLNCHSFLLLNLSGKDNERRVKFFSLFRKSLQRDDGRVGGEW